MSERHLVSGNSALNGRGYVIHSFIYLFSASDLNSNNLKARTHAHTHTHVQTQGYTLNQLKPIHRPCGKAVPVWPDSPVPLTATEQ